VINKFLIEELFVGLELYLPREFICEILYHQNFPFIKMVAGELQMYSFYLLLCICEYCEYVCLLLVCLSFYLFNEDVHQGWNNQGWEEPQEIDQPF